MNAGVRLLLSCVCFLTVCVVGCASPQWPKGTSVPVSKVDLTYPKPQPVYFGFNEYRITPQAAQALQRDAEWLKYYPQTEMVISGNADQRGGKEYNLWLAQQRADAVKNQLVQLGVNPNRLQTVEATGRTGRCVAKPTRIATPLTGEQILRQ